MERVDSKFKDRAPRLATDLPGKQGAYFLYEGLDPHPLGVGLAAGKTPEELAQFLQAGTYADARPGGWDPAARMADMEIDGVEAEVLYTTLGFRIFWLKDPALQAECFRVYNDWLAEFCSYAPDRLAGLAMVPVFDPQEGARELQRCAEMGLKGAMIWCSPPQEQPYSSTVYDPFWAAAQEMNMPISLHAITGVGRESQWNFSLEERYMRATILHHEVERSFSVLIFSAYWTASPTSRWCLRKTAQAGCRSTCSAWPRLRAQPSRIGLQHAVEAQRVLPAPDVLHVYRRLRGRGHTRVHRR